MQTLADMQTLTEDWADGEYSFRLGYGQWIELQRQLDLGPLEMLEAMISRKWRVGQSREIIRLALIGGGTSPADALRLVRTYVEQRPPTDSVGLAARILETGLWAPRKEDDDAGEPPAGPPSTGELTPPPSTEAQQS